MVLAAGGLVGNTANLALPQVNFIPSQRGGVAQAQARVNPDGQQQAVFSVGSVGHPAQFVNRQLTARLGDGTLALDLCERIDGGSGLLGKNAENERQQGNVLVESARADFLGQLGGIVGGVGFRHVAHEPCGVTFGKPRLERAPLAFIVGQRSRPRVRTVLRILESRPCFAHPQGRIGGVQQLSRFCLGTLQASRHGLQDSNSILGEIRRNLFRQDLFGIALGCAFCAFPEALALEVP